MALRVENVKERYAKQAPVIKIMVAGDSGAGKTRFASTFPNTLFADAEAGLLSVRDRDVRSITVTSTTVLDELRAALAQTPDVRTKVLGTPVDTIVLDTVDEIARLIIRERLRAEKRETMAMADWGYLGDTLRAMLRGFRNLPLNVVLNVHLKTSEDSETGRVDYKPSIQGSVGDEIAAYVDESFLLVGRPMTDPNTGERVIARHLQTYPDSQHRWVKDRSGKLPQEFPVDFNTDYQRLAELIFGQSDQRRDTAGPASPAPTEAPRSSTRRATAPGASVTPAPSPAADAATVPVSPNGGTSETSGTEPVDADKNATGSADTDGDPLPCTDCGTVLDRIADENQIAHSIARWKVPLCRTCYVARKDASKTPAVTGAGE